MTPLQTLEIRASEIRTRLSEMGGIADLTDEHRSELDRLRNEYQDNERRQSAMKIAGDAVRPRYQPTLPKHRQTVNCANFALALTLPITSAQPWGG